MGRSQLDADPTAVLCSLATDPKLPGTSLTLPYLPVTLEASHLHRHITVPVIASPFPPQLHQLFPQDTTTVPVLKATLSTAQQRHGERRKEPGTTPSTWPFCSVYFAPFFPLEVQSKVLWTAQARQANSCSEPFALAGIGHMEMFFVSTAHLPQTVAEEPCSLPDPQAQPSLSALS